MRHFRDHWLAIQPSGIDAIAEYYKIAPLVVTALELSSEKNVIYGDIWHSYILPCIELIELTEYEACQDLYREMVSHLTQQFIEEEYIK